MSLADAQTCERVLRAHSRTFHLASLFLPQEQRRGALALYAFCRMADDIVDDATIHLSAPADVRARLDAHAAGLDAVFRGTPTTAVFREVAWTVERFGVPRAPLDELIAGVARDLDGCRYEDWTDLALYCEGVASSVGEMCTYVWGVRDRGSLPAAVAHARTLGTAMQLTNILRDVGEDARRTRCYLPVAELAAFGFTPDDVLRGAVLRRRAAWTGFMRFQVARARSLYAAAAPGIPLLAREARRCAAACSAGYASILDAIARQDYDSVTRRATVGWIGRAGVLARAWWRPAARGALPAAAPAPAGSASTLASVA